MRNTDKRSLLLQAADRLLRRQSLGNLLAHKCRQDLAPRGHDLLPHDDPLRVQSLSRPRARNRVMVGDDRRGQSPLRRQVATKSSGRVRESFEKIVWQWNSTR